MEELSIREKEVVHLLKMGLCNKDIGNNLGITDKGVKFHLTKIFKKYGVKGRHILIAMLNCEKLP